MYRVVAFYTAISQGRRYVPYRQEKSTVEIKRGNATPLRGDAQSMPEGKRVQSKKSPSITQPVVNPSVSQPWVIASSNAGMKPLSLPNAMMRSSPNAVLKPSPLPHTMTKSTPNTVTKPSPLPKTVKSTPSSNAFNAIPKPPPARMQPPTAREPPKNSLASLAMALQQFNNSFSLVCCNKERMDTITGY